MKNFSKFFVLFFCFGLFACGSSKQAVNTDTGKGKSANSANNPFGQTYKMPCAMYDDDDWFGATGIANGFKSRMDVIQTAALTNAQNLVRQKIKHAYKGMITDYSNYMGNNAGTDATTKVERAGDQVIDAIIGDTQAKCIEFSATDDKGYISCYVGIVINKKDMIDKVVDKISKDDELKIRFDEEQFRKSMEEKLLKFRDNQ